MAQGGACKEDISVSVSVHNPPLLHLQAEVTDGGFENLGDLRLGGFQDLSSLALWGPPHHLYNDDLLRLSHLVGNDIHGNMEQ